MKKKKKPKRAPLFSSADALRDNDFVPLPRLWVKRSAMPEIHEIAHRFSDDVKALRQRVTDINAAFSLAEPQDDPKQNKNAAWEAAEKARRQG